MTSSPTRDGGEIDVVGALPHTLRANGDVSEELKVLADTLDDDVRSPLDNNDLESNGSSSSQRSSPGRRRAWNRDDDEPMLQDNEDRFSLFPVKHVEVWKMYKQAVASF